MKNSVLIFLFLSFNLSACINKFEPVDIQSLMGEHKESEKKFMLQINQAVELILSSEYLEAIDILLLTEAEFPNHYETATNLGTAYELNEEIESAMFWIKKGIELNPEAHDGTEWLHYKILDANKNILNNSEWLKDNSIIEISTAGIDDSIKAISYQLSERTQFVQPPNQIVADLYYLLGMLYQRNENEFLMSSSFKNSLIYGDLRKDAILKEKRKNRKKLSLIPDLTEG